jgi:hypothetical protein
MPRSSLFDVLSLQDPASSWNFDLFLPTIPGSSDTRDLTYKCMTTDLPGSGMDNMEVALHGVSLQYAGRRIYTHTLNATFLETADWSTREKFKRWHDEMRSWTNNSGSIAAAYKVNAQIVVYNDIPEVVRTCNIIGLWPETVTEVPLDGSASNLITLQISFRYDYWEDS